MCRVATADRNDQMPTPLSHRRRWSLLRRRTPNQVNGTLAALLSKRANKIRFSFACAQLSDNVFVCSGRRFPSAFCCRLVLRFCGGTLIHQPNHSRRRWRARATDRTLCGWSNKCRDIAPLWTVYTTPSWLYAMGSNGENRPILILSCQVL